MEETFLDIPTATVEMIWPYPFDLAMVFSTCADITGRLPKVV